LPAKSSCSPRTYTDTSIGGGTKLLRLQEHGCAGVLTDEPLRDFDKLARYDSVAYRSGEATRWGGDCVTPFQVNVPVVVDRVGVSPARTCSLTRNTCGPESAGPGH